MPGTLVVPSVRASRDRALDFVKGALVLVMVLYHWLNYFVTLDWDVYRYLRFLTPSFIFVTGFLVSRVYLPRYSCDSPVLRERLVSRGVKLILLFVALNAGMRLLVRPHLAGPGEDLLSLARSVFLIGEKGAAFNVLVSIGYFLVVSPFLLSAAKRARVSLFTLAGLLVLLAIVAAAAGWANFHLEMIAIAFVGLACGAVNEQTMARWTRHFQPLVLVYGVYLVAIYYLNVPFWLQVVGVCASVALIYRVAQRVGASGFAQRQIIEMGEYSLFCYVAQIALLQALRRVVPGEALSGVGLLIPLGLCLVLLALALQTTRTLRAHYAAADRVYRLIFA
jgi:hypothetical protein